MKIIFDKKMQVTNQQKYELIKMEGRVEGYRDMLLHYLNLAPSWLNELREKIIGEEHYQEDVQKFIDGLVPVKSVLITDNVNQEFAGIKKRQGVIGV